LIAKERNIFFTILTAALNSSATLKLTLTSIREQIFQDLEHIVVDGGSCDETQDILRTFESSYNLTWISEPDRGISHALNKGLRLARGRYILIIQADDQLLSPDILESVYSLLKDERFDIYSFPVILDHPHNGKVLRKPIQLFWWNHFKFIFLHQGCFVHQRVFSKIGGFREKFKINLDYDFFYRALANNSTVKFGKFPTALMGGYGIGGNPKFTLARLREEKLVQALNERNPLWKAAQFFFRMVYMPYKIHLLPKLKNGQYYDNFRS
jgi:glycosyltransferase involved in cell wall biosynthesis